MIQVNVKAFVDESEMVSAVADHLKISHSESEKLYCDLGGYSGNGPVNFSTTWPDDDVFSVAVQEFMTAKGIDSLMVGYDD
jgi:hypothetical protein